MNERSLPTHLFFLNLFRWIRHHWLSWGVLAGIYSIAATVLFTAILELRFKQEPEFWTVWTLLVAVLGVPALFEYFSFPGIPAIRAARPRSLTLVYVLHELRRPNAWIACLLPLLAALIFDLKQPTMLLILTQLSPQRALYSIHKWRTYALSHSPLNGVRELILGFSLTQLVLLSPWVFVNPSYLPLGVAGVLLGSSLIFEGDSGRPGLVNAVVLTGALLGALLASLHTLVILFCGYFMLRMGDSVRERLRSVEYFDEDTLL
jgi:hypothetical protein